MKEEGKTYIYIDEEGKELPVDKWNYYRLWLKRYLQAGDIDPLRYIGGAAEITIEEGEYTDQNLSEENTLYLQQQNHYIPLLGLSIFSLCGGIECRLHLGREISLNSEVPTTLEWIGFHVDGGDIFDNTSLGNGEYSSRGQKYVPRWEMHVRIANDEGVDREYRELYVIPFYITILEEEEEG